MRKMKFYGLLAAGCLLWMTSCLSDTTTTNDWELGNAQISAFSLSHDSIAGLSSVSFTIDQVNGKIYNRDSMPYGTPVEKKLICTLSYELGAAAGVLFVPQSTGDSIWSTADSIDFSAPVMITVYAYDQMSTKTYEARLNVHQIQPDSMVWQRTQNIIPEFRVEDMVFPYTDMRVVFFKNQYYMYVKAINVIESHNSYLYRSDDGVNWTNEYHEVVGWRQYQKWDLPQIIVCENELYTISLENGKLYRSENGYEWTQAEDTPDIKTLLGAIPAASAQQVTTKSLETPPKHSVLCGIATVDGDLRFVAKQSTGEWITGDKAPATFPLSGFGHLTYESMHFPRLAVVGGLNVAGETSDLTWSTMDGLAWSLMTKPNYSFTPREGAAVSFYDGSFFVIGGFDASGAALKDVYRSKDFGITWTTDTITQLCVMPDDYAPRGFSSVVTDKDNYMLLFGGKASKEFTDTLDELWRGRINRLGFDKK